VVLAKFGNIQYFIYLGMRPGRQPVSDLCTFVYYPHVLVVGIIDFVLCDFRFSINWLGHWDSLNRNFLKLVFCQKRIAMSSWSRGAGSNTDIEWGASSNGSYQGGGSFGASAGDEFQQEAVVFTSNFKQIVFHFNQITDQHKFLTTDRDTADFREKLYASDPLSP